MRNARSLTTASLGMSKTLPISSPGNKPTRQSAIQTLAFNSCGFGHLGDAAAGLRNTTQGDQEHAGLIVILQRRPEILRRELWIVAQFTRRGLIVRYARLAFHNREIGLRSDRDECMPILIWS